MLPATNESNALNAAFVADNSVEVAEGCGNDEQRSEEENVAMFEIDESIEAETNKPLSSGDVNNEMGHHGTAAATIVKEKKLVVSQDDVENSEEQAHTIENNEEAEVNDSRNESSNVGIEADAAVAVTSAIEAKDDLLAELDDENVEEAGDETAEQTMSVERSAEWVDGKAKSSLDGDFDGVDTNPSETHYINNANREDVSSSDDEIGSETMEMGPVFKSEWADLAEQLAQKNYEANDLSNDIDAYDVVPVDLSNDIAVNNLAAANHDFAINPDAEIINIDGMTRPRNTSMPNFEKLTISATMNL